jgi:predicted CoA-binding protein
MPSFANIFANTKTIAIVGLSANPSRASYGVAQALMPYFEVIPVNPAYEEVLGLRCYPDLQSVPQKIDMVDLFQRRLSNLPLISA